MTCLKWRDFSWTFCVNHAAVLLKTSHGQGQETSPRSIYLLPRKCEQPDKQNSINITIMQFLSSILGTFAKCTFKMKKRLCRMLPFLKIADFELAVFRKKMKKMGVGSETDNNNKSTSTQQRKYKGFWDNARANLLLK